MTLSAEELSAVKVPPDLFARLLEDMIRMVNEQPGNQDLMALAVDGYIAHNKVPEDLGQDTPEFATMVQTSQAAAMRLNALANLIGGGHLDKWRDGSGMIDLRHPAVVAAALSCPVQVGAQGPQFQPMAFAFQADAAAAAMGKR